MTGQIHHYRPSELHYTQDSISKKFSDGTPLADTLSNILDDKGYISLIEPVEVMKYCGKEYVVNGNRRLYLYKKLEDEGLLETVPITKRSFDHDVFMEKFTTENGGTSVEVRDDWNGTFVKKLEDIIDDY